MILQPLPKHLGHMVSFLSAGFDEAKVFEFRQRPLEVSPR
jgi:hypothetical protein